MVAYAARHPHTLQRHLHTAPTAYPLTHVDTMAHTHALQRHLHTSTPAHTPRDMDSYAHPHSLWKLHAAPNYDPHAYVDAVAFTYAVQQLHSSSDGHAPMACANARYPCPT